MVSIDLSARCWNMYFDAPTDDEDEVPECLSWTKLRKYTTTSRRTYKRIASSGCYNSNVDENDIELESSPKCVSDFPPQTGISRTFPKPRRIRRGRPAGFYNRQSLSVTAAMFRRRIKPPEVLQMTSSGDEQFEEADQPGQCSSLCSVKISDGNTHSNPPSMHSFGDNSSLRPRRCSRRRQRQQQDEIRYQEVKRQTAIEVKKREETQKRIQEMFLTAMKLKSVAKRFMAKSEVKAQAATTIQTAVRRYLARAKEKRLLEKRNAKQRRKVQKWNAATIIYRNVMRYHTLTAKERRTEEKIKAKTKRRQQKYGALIKVQRAVRQYLARTESRRIQRKNDAATQIQWTYRMYACRTATKRAEEKRIADERWQQQKHLATLKVKSAVNKYMFSVKFIKKLHDKRDHDLLAAQTKMKVQKVIRKYMLSVRFMNKLEEKKDYDLRKITRQNEIQTIQNKIDMMHQQTNHDINQMQLKMIDDKHKLCKQNKMKMESLFEEDILDSLNAEMERIDKEDKKRQEITKLEKQSQDLQLCIEDVQQNISRVEEENLDLQKANLEIKDMYDTLNRFARRKFEDKKKLVPAYKKYSQQILPKIKKEIVLTRIAGMSENKMKESTRGYLYKILNSVHDSDRYDQILYDDILYEIQRCETSRGSKMSLPTAPDLRLNKNVDNGGGNSSFEFPTNEDVRFGEGRNIERDFHKDEFNSSNQNGNSFNDSSFEVFDSSQFFDSNNNINFGGGAEKSISNIGGRQQNYVDTTYSNIWDESYRLPSRNTNNDDTDFNNSKWEVDFGTSQNFYNNNSTSISDFDFEDRNDFNKSNSLNHFFNNHDTSKRWEEDDCDDQGSEHAWDDNDGDPTITLTTSRVNWDALSAWTEDD